jgi:uncharacterized LabA/DUF88 family protein
MRTAIYIDGFNFYYGAVKGTPYKWLDPKAMCQNILKFHHQICSIIYCTALVNSRQDDPDAPLRQATYIKALSKHITEIKVIYGHFLENKTRMKPVDSNNGKTVEVYKVEEKGSDVNLAVHLVNDAWKDVYDCAIVISNDSDLAEAMKLVRVDCKKTVGLFTPWRRRASKQLMANSDFQRTIRKSTIVKSQLPSPIKDTKIYKPSSW